ncbi:MAG TPA: formate--tetrahydrofolate ligase [bacterium]|nr:formate--tetrahydrofolate ligase [bacterium]
MEKHNLKDISEIASDIDIPEHLLERYGKHKAKIKLDALSEFKDRKKGRLILVSAITPTPAGEGKTTTSIGLSIGLNRIGYKSIVTLREPSLGPLFGIKGGATGGGKTTVLPDQDINLHFTGDIHAVTAAHNLIAAALDNHIYRRKEPRIDHRQIKWSRALDMNDRSLRDIVIGLGGKTSGVPRESNFIISAASEIMAILGFAESYDDLKKRLGNILLGYTYENKPVYLKDLNISGSVAALLKDALKPNLVQTSENTPAFVHGGPFANIAQGTCTATSMRLAEHLSDFVVTEAGFGFDLGAEKFFDIVARKTGLHPDALVLVATVRALKMHGGKKLGELDEPDPAAVERGLPNLEKHIENMEKFNVCPVVAINKFAQDTDEEIKVIEDFVKSKNVRVSVVDSAIRGGEGAEDLARKVTTQCEFDDHYSPLYKDEDSIKEKIKTVTSEIYGSKAVDYTKEAEKDIEKIKDLGLENLPVCIAKTQKSLSDNPELLGRPKDFLVTVRKIDVSAGAGFLIPITGDILLMPGLPETPAAENIDISDDGDISGIF